MAVEGRVRPAVDEMDDGEVLLVVGYTVAEYRRNPGENRHLLFTERGIAFYPQIEILYEGRSAPIRNRFVMTLHHSHSWRRRR